MSFFEVESVIYGALSRLNEGVFMSYQNPNDAQAVDTRSVEAYERARMAHTAPAVGRGGLGPIGAMPGLQARNAPPDPGNNRLVQLAGHMDQLVNTSRVVAQRLEDAVVRIHGESPEIATAKPDQSVGPGVLGTLEKFAQWIEAAQLRQLRALTRLEEVG